MMKRSRARAGLAAALIFSGLAAAPSMSETTQALPPFQAHVDMKTFMEHVLTPAATLIWRANGSVIDAGGEHDLSPRTDNDWENITSGAATLAEATNALMIPGRAPRRMTSKPSLTSAIISTASARLAIVTTGWSELFSPSCGSRRA
jgi:hypothetical protein